MTICKPGLIASLLLLITASCAAQTINGVQPSIKRVGEPAANLKVPDSQETNLMDRMAERRRETNPPAPTIETKPMPGAGIERATLEQVLQSIHEAQPEFNSVVVRANGVPSDYPTIPTMSFKNVTIGQFLQFLQVSFPGITCYRIDGDAGPLYSFRINPDNSANFGGGGRGGFNQLQKPNPVHLYRLTEIINNLADDNATKDGKDAKDIPQKDRIKAATDEVLSLLQAALDQTDADGPCVLKMHDPTLTLLFKGSAVKQSVLEDAINSLQGNRRGGFAGGGGSGYARTLTANPSTGMPYNLSQEADIDAYNQALLRYQDELVKREKEMALIQERIAQFNKMPATKPSKD